MEYINAVIIKIIPTTQNLLNKKRCEPTSQENFAKIRKVGWTRWEKKLNSKFPISQFFNYE